VYKYYVPATNSANNKIHINFVWFIFYSSSRFEDYSVESYLSSFDDFKLINILEDIIDREIFNSSEVCDFVGF